jgi:hypothetical protein
VKSFIGEKLTGVGDQEIAVFSGQKTSSNLDQSGDTVQSNTTVREILLMLLNGA